MNQYIHQKDVLTFCRIPIHFFPKNLVQFIFIPYLCIANYQLTFIKSSNMRKLPAICKLPEQLYKFYRFDPQFNESRLKGEVYLSNAIEFNDPLDCRIDVVNNTQEKEKGFVIDGWLDHKLRELNFRGKSNREEIANKLLIDDRETVQMVWQRQLERMGILCLTPEIDNILMWGYYTGNKGFCIEYNTENLIHDIVIGYVTPWTTTLPSISIRKGITRSIPLR